MDEAIVIFCTVPNEEVGSRIAEALVRDCYAACVNILPGITSIYQWKGRICRDGELLLIIKTRKRLFDAACEIIRAQHPYEVPEIIALDIKRGNESYLRWLEEVTDNIL